MTKLSRFLLLLLLLLLWWWWYIRSVIADIWNIVLIIFDETCFQWNLRRRILRWILSIIRQKKDLFKTTVLKLRMCVLLLFVTICVWMCIKHGSVYTNRVNAHVHCAGDCRHTATRTYMNSTVCLDHSYYRIRWDLHAYSEMDERQAHGLCMYARNTDIGCCILYALQIASTIEFKPNRRVRFDKVPIKEVRYYYLFGTSISGVWQNKILRMADTYREGEKELNSSKKERER